MLGIGIDIVDLEQFAGLVVRPDAPFVQDHFTGREIATAFSAASGQPAQHLAARYAAKEAAIKALDQARGGLFRPVGAVDYRAIEVTTDGAHRPQLEFHGAFAQFAKSVGIGQARVSLSHDGRYAVAMVCVE